MSKNKDQFNSDVNDLILEGVPPTLAQEEVSRFSRVMEAWDKGEIYEPTDKDNLVARSCYEIMKQNGSRSNSN